MNLSIPSIPSRYLMPNLDINENEILDPNLPYEALGGNKLKRLVEDRSRIGPGCY
jgi:hypothetical protein